MKIVNDVKGRLGLVRLQHAISNRPAGNYVTLSSIFISHLRPSHKLQEDF